ncbi:MAG: hypothetical protein JWM34_4525 [Ilumatobacteraceae bacterium]|nr:hypothetical protein [Ilumatobacteraceae bacterium]
MPAGSPATLTWSTTQGTTVSTTGAAPPDSADDTLATEPAGPLGGVTADDPLPAEVDATDPASAETAVRYAYTHWILVDLDAGLRGRLVEDGEGNAANMDTRMQAIRGTIADARLAVDAVQFADPIHADVVFRVEYAGNQSPYFPNSMIGSAIFQNGTWRITRASLCQLAFSFGQGCPGAATDNPVSPTAFALPVIPAGYVRLDGAVADAPIPDPGVAAWASGNGNGDDHLTITVEALAGVSKLTGNLADAVLSAPRLGTADGEPTAVGDFAGRIARHGPTVVLAYLRHDDVLVTIQAVGSTVDQVLAVAADLQPAT